MSTNRDPGEPTDGIGTTGREAPRASESPPRLASTLVTYSDRPDRRTVYPPGLSSVARMSTWFTADEGSFVDLGAMR